MRGSGLRRSVVAPMGADAAYTDILSIDWPYCKRG